MVATFTAAQRLMLEHTTRKPSDLPVHLDADVIDHLEATNCVIVADTTERIEVGPFDGRYLIVQAPDLVAAADALRRLADRIIDVALDARTEKLEADRHNCLCGARLEADECTCGAARCEREYALDAAS